MNIGKTVSAKNLSLLLSSAIITLGVALRVIVYIANRDLWTDEVGLALNIYEREFTSLLSPLAYGQYAPPLFLWVIKFLTLLFGYSEQAFRLYPLITGIASLFIIHSIAKTILSQTISWYPVLLIATGIFYLRYSTELKQYMPDAFISLLLIFLALKTNTLKLNKKRFAAIWIMIGSIAIWQSMPSVFILAGIGLYYGTTYVRQRKLHDLLQLTIISLVWLIQFLLYYFLVLTDDIQSDFLINFHDKYFLQLFSTSSNVWENNKLILETALSNAFGGSTFSLILNLLFLLFGWTIMIIKKDRLAFLLIFPVLTMFIASALGQYSLISRLTLFCMPLMLLSAAIGMDFLIKKRAPYINATIIIACFVAFVANQPQKVFSQPIVEENISAGLDYVADGGYTSEQLYIYTGAVNSYRYYTKVHPKKERYYTINSAHLITEATNFDKLITYLPSTSILLYTIPFDSYYTKSIFQKNANCTDTINTAGCTLFLFQKEY